MTKRRSITTRLLVTAALAVPLASLPARVAHADESRRSSLKSDIERLLSDMASELRDVPGDSSASDLERTMTYAGTIADKARELKDHVEGDSDAGRMADNYPEYVRHYLDAARSLRELENDHRRLDEYPKTCEDAMRELAGRLRGFTDSHDPRGADEVPRLARELGKIGKDAVDQADGTKRMVYERYDRVDDFSDSDGKWSDVKSYLHGAGRTMYDHTTRTHDQIKRDDVCGDLAKEDRNPLVEQAMTKLFDGKKGIELVYESMDRQLGEAASALDRLEGDSNDADIQTADGKLGEVERLLEQLDRIKGNDGEARRRVETWRTLVRAGREGLTQLRILKEAQFRADKAPEKCRESTEGLRTIIRGFTDTHDTDGETAIPLRARGIAGPVKAGLDKTDEQHPIMERALAEAQRFDPSEGRWREVSDRHRASAAAIFDHWKKAREAAHAACDELAKGDQHADVVQAVRDLGRKLSDAKTELLALQALHREWNEDTKQLRGWYKQDTQNVRQLFCSLPESPGDSAEGDAYAAQLTRIADRMRDRLQPEWQTISSDAIKLKALADVLIQQKDQAVSRSAANLRTEVNRKMGSLENLLNNELRGANDPEFRAQLEVGKNEHTRIQHDSSKCEADEVTIPGAGLRMDCVRVSSGTCYIVEIKPNNPDAEKAGRTKLGKYKNAMEEYFKDNRSRVDDAFKSDELQIFKRCIADGRISLETELRVYELCPPDGKMFVDFIVE